MAPDDHSFEGRAPSGLAVPRDVRDALAYMRRALTQRITMPELAQLSGVPKRTLHRHFVAFVGAAPLEHFRRMRLAASREALLAPTGDAATVTDIATRFGFAHLGRFAADYRRRFAEAPSATLARGQMAMEQARAGAMADRASAGVYEGQAEGYLSYPARRRDVGAIAVIRFRLDPGSYGLLNFAESLAEQLASELSRAHGFAVRPVRVAPGEDEARARGLRYCLAGQVMRAPDGKVQVVAQLRDLSDGDRHVWGDAYHGTVDDLVGLLGQTVDAVVAAVRPGIEATEIECARRRPRSDLRASDLVLRALPFVLAADPISAQVALGPLEEAMELDPDDPRPVALAAWCRTQLVVYGRIDCNRDARRQAMHLADRAGALDPLADPLVLTARSAALMGAGRLDEAKDLLARGVAIDPRFGWVWERTGWTRALCGQGEATLDCFRRAIALKGVRAPLSNCLAGVGAAHFGAGQFAEAARWVNRALAENPGAVWLNRILAPSHIACGDLRAAAASIDCLLRDYPDMTTSYVLSRTSELLPRSADGWVRDAHDRIANGLVSLGLPA